MNELSSHEAVWPSMAAADQKRLTRDSLAAADF